MEEEIIFENEHFKLVKTPDESLKARATIEIEPKIEMSELEVWIDIGIASVSDYNLMSDSYLDKNPEDRGVILKRWRKKDSPIQIKINKRQIELTPKELLQLINEYTEILQSAIDIVNKAESYLMENGFEIRS